MKLDEAKCNIQELVEKNHKLETEYKNKEQILMSKEKYIDQLLNQAMNKGIELDKIHKDYNEKVVVKDKTIQNFSEKHNNEINSITKKYINEYEELSNG